MADVAESFERESYTDRITPSFVKRSKLLRVIVLAICVGLILFLARLFLGLLYAAIHYSVTPTLEEYAKTHIVSDEAITEFLPSGTILSTNKSWSVGRAVAINEGEAELKEKLISIAIHLKHGERTLAKLSETFTLSLDKKWDHHAVDIKVQSLETADNFRCLAITSLSDPEEMVGEGSMGKGMAMIDFFLMSGNGSNEHRFSHNKEGLWHSSTDYLPSSTPTKSSMLIAAVTGITCNTSGPPEKGLIHHVRQKVRFDWTKDQTGHGGPSFSFPDHYLNSQEYSYHLSIKHGGDYKASVKQSLERQWNGEIW